MLSLLVHPDETDEVQPQTRQEQREAIREKKRVANQKKKLNQRPEAAKPYGKKTRTRKEKAISFADHCFQVAAMVVRVAEDIEQLPDEEKRWFDGRDSLIEALARQHNVVDKYRQAFTPTTRYEYRVINAALTICEIGKLLKIETKVGWLRLQVVAHPYFSTKTHRQLRVA
jgi:hypothetical protein